MSEQHDVAEYMPEPKAAPAPAPAFNLSRLAYTQTADMAVMDPISLEPTSWVITLGGPGHPATVAMQDQLSRRIIEQRRQREEAMTNGRKWRAPEETPEGNTQQNAMSLAKRIITWTPVILEEGAPPVQFSVETASAILANPDFGWLYDQIRKFLLDDAGFIKTPRKN